MSEATKEERRMFRTGVAATAVALALGLAACGGNSNSASGCVQGNLRKDGKVCEHGTYVTQTAQVDPDPTADSPPELPPAPSGVSPSTSSRPTSHLTMAQRCDRFGRKVAAYDYVREGTSPHAYTILLHTLQASCPAAASRVELTGLGLGLPKCATLAQEHCTAYQDPQVGKPTLP